jgi:hypothetical protein
VIASKIWNTASPPLSGVCMMRLAMRPAKSFSKNPTDWRSTCRCARQRINVPNCGRMALFRSATSIPCINGRISQDEQRGEDQFRPVVGKNLRRRAVGQQVHHPPHVPDQPDLDRRHDKGHECRRREERLEGLRVVPHKREQPTRRRVRVGVGRIGIDQGLEIMEQSGKHVARRP